MNKTNTLTKLLVVSILINVFSYTQISNLRSTVSDLKNIVYETKTTVNGLNNKIDQMQKEEKWVQEIDFNIDSSKTSGYNVKANVEVTFNRLTDRDTPFVGIRNNNDEKWTELPLKESNALNFKANLNLDSRYEYEYKVYTKGSEYKSTDIKPIPDKLYKVPSFSVEYGYSRKAVEMNIYFEYLLKNDQLMPKEVSLVISEVDDKNTYQYNFEPIGDLRELQAWNITLLKKELNLDSKYEAHISVVYGNDYKKDTDLSEEFNDLILR